MASCDEKPDPQPMTLQRLLNEPKGKTEYHPNQAFLLHVFWEAPSAAAADTVLAALQRCASATHRDTPCVPTYLFRRTSLDADLLPEAPKSINQHPQLLDAIRKIKVGVPRPAVEADLRRRGIDPKLVDEVGMTALPEAMKVRPVMMEFTELYLDERSFYEHAGSRDYLEAYGEVLAPGLMNKQVTIRMGTPTAEITDKILAPMLKEKVEPIPTGGVLWRQPTTSTSSGILLALSVTGSADEISRKIPKRLRDHASTCLAFSHPLAEDRARVLCFLPSFPDSEVLRELVHSLSIRDLEVQCEAAQRDEVVTILERAGLGGLAVVDTRASGYAIHEKAGEVKELDGQ